MNSLPWQFYLGYSQRENFLGDFQMQRKTVTLPNKVGKSGVFIKNITLIQKYVLQTVL